MKIKYWYIRLSEIKAQGGTAIDLIDQMQEYYERHISMLESLLKFNPDKDDKRI